MKKIYWLFILLVVCSADVKLQTICKETLLIARSEAASRGSLLLTSHNSAASNNFDISFYRCEWYVDPVVKYINGVITSYFSITSATNSITYDLNHLLIVDSVRFRGNNISYQQTTSDVLHIQFPLTLSVNQKDSVTVFYKGVPSADGFGAFVKSSHNGVPVVWTLSEPYGAKDWWPCKNGLNDKTDSLDVIITTPIAYRGVSNGMQVNEWTSGANRTTYFKHRYSIASYLVGIAATNYQIYTDSVSIAGKNLPLISYVYPEYYAVFASEERFTKLAMQIFGSVLGDYPFSKEKYGHTQFGWGGGIEHQTNSFILWPWDFLISHELAHQWFGDKVTCGSWEDIWLNEGFATFFQVFYTEKTNPAGIPNNLQGIINSITSETGGSVKVTDTTDVGRIFSGRLSYHKGFYLAHMLRGKLGDSIFFRGLRQYLNDPQLQYGYAKTADFIRNMETVSNKNLQEFFKDWYAGEGYANYQLEWTQNKNKWVKVKLNQTTSHPSVSFYEMPVTLQFKNASRDTTFIVEHIESGQVFWLNPGFEPDTVIIDPKLWILAKEKVSKKVTAASDKTNEVKIFPNPAPDKVYISLLNPSAKKIFVQLYNAAGQLIYKKEVETPGRDEIIDIPMSNLPKGVYMLTVKDNNELNLTKKIVK